MTVDLNTLPDFKIDRSRLTQVKNNFLTFNKSRLERTSASLDYRQKIFLELISLLFHVNHPVLPGYVSSETPAGVQQYKPCKNTLKIAKTLSKSFRFQSLTNQQASIEALFVMGSIGTIGQSRSSDLDFWVCHDPKLSQDELIALQKKCDNISLWAKSLGLEAVFFLMNAGEFKRGKSSALSEESSGSAQHKLLLDEFYRTGILIAGRYPLWWFVDPDYETYYTQYSNTLLEKKFIQEKHVIDFGGLDKIDPQEFITASIWQLYKSIESPYKSILKLLLLEVYASRKSQQEILCVEFKSKIFSGKTSIDDLDPYFLIYKANEAYLQKNNQDTRIDLLRRCFYLKVNRPLSKKPHTSPQSWQRISLQKIVQQWSWKKEHIQLLDKKSSWNALQVIDEKQIIINELLSGYKFLTHFFREHGTANDINQNKEINLLGRKLFSAFERRSGKIENINPNISKNISASHLTFKIKEQPAKTDQWSVYCQTKNDELTAENQLFTCSSLIELICWTYCNKIYTEQTHAAILHKDKTINARGFYSSLEKWRESVSKSTKKISFESKPTPLNILIFINIFGYDSEDISDSEQGNLDVLSYGKNHLNLINDIHMVVHNSWNETTVYSHETNTVQNFMCDFFNLKNPHQNKNNPNIIIHCENQHLSAQIKQRILSLLSQTKNLFEKKSVSSKQLVINVESNFLAFEANNNNIISYNFISREQLLDHLSKPRQDFCSTVFDEKTLLNDPLNALYLTANKNHNNDSIQVFYLANKSTADVYVLDEKNSLTQYFLPFQDEQSLLRPLHRFIRSIIHRQQLRNDDLDNFGIYPVEFFQLKKERNGIYIASPRHVINELSNLQFFNIQAIANHGQNHEIEFSIYCDDTAFHTSEHGQDTYNKVAQHILSHRKNAEKYPCYLTDLDLSNMPPNLTGPIALQTAHFLQYKKQIEQNLNQALGSL
jgi:adenylate cyclase class 1